MALLDEALAKFSQAAGMVGRLWDAGQPTQVWVEYQPEGMIVHTDASELPRKVRFNGRETQVWTGDSGRNAESETAKWLTVDAADDDDAAELQLLRLYDPRMFASTIISELTQEGPDGGDRVQIAGLYSLSDVDLKLPGPWHKTVAEFGLRRIRLVVVGEDLLLMDQDDLPPLSGPFEIRFARAHSGQFDYKT